MLSWVNGRDAIEKIKRTLTFTKYLTTIGLKRKDYEEWSKKDWNSFKSHFRIQSLRKFSKVNSNRKDAPQKKV